MASASTSTSQIGYPSDVIRPVPSFTLEIPDGWVAAELPGALVAVGTPADDAGPWANVIVRHERTTRTMTLEAAAKGSWARMLASHPDAELLDERLARAGDVVQYVRETRIPSDEDDDTQQVQSFFFGPTEDRLTLDLFEITCLTPGAASDAHAPAFAGILGSFRFTD